MIESPCIGVCTLINKKCIGCYRTADEISNWLFYEESERKIIIKKCFKKMQNTEVRLSKKK